MKTKATPKPRLVSNKFLFIRTSSNAKIGPMPCVIVSRGTCPTTCPLYNGGCYALSGPMALHWKRANDGISLKELAKKIKELPFGQVWRYATAGDLPGTDLEIDAKGLAELVKANKGKRGYTYTHKPLTDKNQVAIKSANVGGFTVNLSSNNLAQADDYLGLKIAPVCTLVAHGNKGDAPWKNKKTPKGAMVVQCPAEYQDDVTCSNCGGAGGPLCARKDRNFVVGFTTHGTQKAKAAKVALNILQ